MAAHLTKDAGGPPPPTRNEVLLREAVDRLRRELDECRTQSERVLMKLGAAQNVMEAAREWCGGEMNYLPRRVARALDVYDKLESDLARGDK